MQFSFRTTLLTALLLPAALLASSAPDPLVEQIKSEASEAMHWVRSPRAAAHLIRLHAMRDQVSDLQLLAHVYSDVLSHPHADPATRALARALLADVERARGRLTKATDLLEPLGYVSHYYLLGGFDNEGKGGCSRDFGPEGSLDLKATYAGKGHPASWRKLSVKSDDGYVDLATAIRPNHEAVAYALTFLQAPRETPATLSLGSSGAFRIWVNGELAALEDRYNRARPDQTRVAVRLRKGVNRVLLKVCQNNGPFGFYFRHERGPGSAARATPVLPDALPPLERGPRPAPKLLPTLSSLLEQEVKKHPDDARLRGEYATVLSYVRAFDESEHRDTNQAKAAAASAPKDVVLQLLAAELQQDEPNLRRKHLETALQAAPDYPFTRLLLAQHELTRGYPERALAVVKPLIREFPGFAAPRLVELHAYDALGEWPRAVDLVERLFQDFPHLPQVAREAATTSRRLDRPEEGASRLRVALALRYDDTNSHRALAATLADMSRVDDAEQELHRLLRLDPFDNRARLHLAELYAGNENLDAATRLFSEAKALSPDEPEVYEREGRALLQSGRRDLALRALEHALQLRPQNPALNEALRSLKGDKGVSGAQYALEVAPLVKEADRLTGEDSVYLVDYTYVRVQASGLSSRFQQTAVKLYTQRGVDAFRSMPITYSPSRQEIQVIRARIIKPDGSVVESHSEQERNMNEPWSGMYYDIRAKILSFPELAPGDVLELRYRLEDTAQDNLLSDYWGDVDHLQATSPKIRYQYIADMPTERALYWNAAKLPAALTLAQEKIDGRTIYRWTIKNLSKIVPEPGMPGWSEVVPTLHVSTYKNWEEVGRYYWGLVRDQLTPNDEVRKAVERALVGVDRKDELAVIRAIYNFVVSKTRYVALEFGIHGFKPYSVDRVLSRGFGDCKDKASLIYAMLKIAGIDSRLVLLRMRQLGAIGESPASLAAFNHAIAYVPKYDLFLDGTAEFHGSRELPIADRLAHVLIIDPAGKSSFRTTPEASSDDNRLRFALQVALRANGDGRVQGESKASGTIAPEFRRSYQTTATRKSTIERRWSQTFPGSTVAEVSVSDPGDVDRDLTWRYQLDVPHYAEALAPAALRFLPFSGLGGSYLQTYAQLAERRFDLILTRPWVNEISVRFTLPTGYLLPDMPPNIDEETKFGHLRISYQWAEGTLSCHAEVALVHESRRPGVVAKGGRGRTFEDDREPRRGTHRRWRRPEVTCTAG